MASAAVQKRWLTASKSKLHKKDLDYTVRSCTEITSHPRNANNVARSSSAKMVHGLNYPK
jgi:hypothetical protein